MRTDIFRHSSRKLQAVVEDSILFYIYTVHTQLQRDIKAIFFGVTVRHFFSFCKTFFMVIYVQMLIAHNRIFTSNFEPNIELRIF